MNEQAQLQEEVLEIENTDGKVDATALLNRILKQQEFQAQQFQSLQTTQAVLMRCLIDKGYIDTESLSRSHSLLIKEAQEEQQKQQAQAGVPSDDGIITGTGKPPTEEAPEVSI